MSSEALAGTGIKDLNDDSTAVWGIKVSMMVMTTKMIDSSKFSDDDGDGPTNASDGAAEALSPEE